MKLILFDVDGILVESGAVKYDFYKEVVKKNFGIEVSRYDTYREGKTDKLIVMDLLKTKGLNVKENDSRLKKTIEDIGPAVERAIKGIKLKQIPGVEKLIKELIKEGDTIGLLTGNTPGKAKAKLKSCGLWKYFAIGAFGEILDRSKLVDLAIKDAKKKKGVSFSKKDIFLIGDTIRDIQCAKKAGVRIISVATGKESLDVLRKEKPDYIFKDFSEISKIMEVIS